MAAAAVLCCVFLFWKARYGFANSDESFYLTIPFRLLSGDRLIVDEWNVTQFSSLLLLLAACHNEAMDPVITGYRMGQLGGLGIGLGGVTTDMSLEVDVTNPSSARYVLESLEAALYPKY